MTRARPRPRSRRGEGDALRDEILAATEKLLIETGSEDAVSIRAVGDLVGVTPPSIYRHFADKQTLLFEVCAAQFTVLNAWLDAAVGDTEDPVEAVMGSGRAYVDFGRTHPEHYRIMFMGRSDLTPEQYADEALVDESCFNSLVRAVQRCLDAGRFRRDGPGGGDAFTIATGLWAAVHGLTSLLIAKPNFPWPEHDTVVDTTLRTALEGLLAD